LSRVERDKLDLISAKGFGAAWRYSFRIPPTAKPEFLPQKQFSPSVILGLAFNSLHLKSSQLAGCLNDCHRRNLP
jgi:hypothetical protein